jgi:hypothetical protein
MYFANYLIFSDNNFKHAAQHLSMPTLCCMFTSLVFKIIHRILYVAQLTRRKTAPQAVFRLNHFPETFSSKFSGIFIILIFRMSF